MAQRTRLLIGLGNPGVEYDGTRHNVGFEVLDRIAQRCQIEWRKDRRADVLTGHGSWRGRSLELAKPQTWMNRSGDAAIRLKKRYGLDPAEILALVDDLHLPLGTLRLRPHGGAGGHNGLQNIIDALDSDRFPRLRIGVGGNYARGGQSTFVLSPFTPEEQPAAAEAIVRAVDAALMFVSEGIHVAMNRYNRRVTESPVTSS